MGNLLERLKDRMDPVPKGHCLIGLSGGADSVALLMLLADDEYRDEIQPEAVHVNHGLRGEESDDDEVFVRELCDGLKIPLHVYHPGLGGRKDENTAREARFRCFRECMAETGADALILAHHADDLAETFMIRLLRGAGPEGLGCMTSSDDRNGIRIIRPMLRIRREEIREALRADGISWREDSSNKDSAYLRNDIRMHLMPLMEETAPGAVLRIAGAARRIAEDNEAMDQEADRFLSRYSGKGWIDSRELADIPRGLQTRILRQWWREYTPPLKEHELSAEQTERLVQLIHAESGKINLPGGLHAVKGKQAIHLTGIPRERTDETPVTGRRTVFGDYALEIRESNGEPGDGKRDQTVPDGFQEGCVIRTRRPGDRIIPFGMTGTRKLQDYLTDRGIDAPWRDRIPLLCRGNEVLLVAGVGAGRIPRHNEQEQSVRLHWEGEMPWSRT